MELVARLNIRYGLGYAVLLILGGLAVILTWAPPILGATVLLGTGLLLVSAVRPAVAATLLAVAIPFGHLAPSPITSVNASDLLAAWLLAVWLARAAAQRSLLLRSRPLMLSLTALLWLMAASLLRAVSWREGLPELLKWAEFAAVYLAAAHVLDRRTAWWVVGGLFLAGVVEAALGVYQFFRMIGPEEFTLAGRYMRAYGTLQQPNPYAGYLGYLAPTALSLALTGLGLLGASPKIAAQASPALTRKRRWREIAIAFGCAGIAAALVLGMVLSWSRGSWLGLAAAIGVVTWQSLTGRTAMSAKAAMAKWVIGAGLVIVLVSTLLSANFLPGPMAARLSDLGDYVIGPDPAGTEITDANFAVLERLAHWQAGLRMFDANPWLGVGIGNYAAVYAAYALPHWYEALGHAHNIYINFLAETGVLGMAAFAAFWIGAFLFAARANARATGYSAALAGGLLGTLMYVSIHNVFDNLFVQHMQLQLALLLAAVVVTGSEKHARSSLAT